MKAFSEATCSGTWSVPGAPMSALSPTAMLEDAEVSYKSCTQTSVSDIHPFPSISIFGKTFHLDLDLFGHAKC